MTKRRKEYWEDDDDDQIEKANYKAKLLAKLLEEKAKDKYLLLGLMRPKLDGEQDNDKESLPSSLHGCKLFRQTNES